MAVPEISVTAADLPAIVAADKECWQLDRVIYGLPTCDVVRRINTGDAFSGVDTASFETLNANVECSIRPYSSWQVANSAGMITPQDQLCIFYDIGQLDEKTRYIKYKGNYWKIMAQDYRSYSGRSELQLRQMSVTV